MPAELPDGLIENAEAAVEYARSVRRVHRRRTEKADVQRAADIKVALDRLKDAMSPIRAEIGRFPYGPQTSVAEKNRVTIKDTSQAIQSERRKLWKMQRRRLVTP